MCNLQEIKNPWRLLVKKFVSKYFSFIPYDKIVHMNCLIVFKLGMMIPDTVRHNV